MSECFPGESLEIAAQMFIWWNIRKHNEVDTRALGRSPYRGYEGIRRWIADIDEQFEEWYSRPDEFHDLKDGRVLVLGELHMRGRESGVELDQPMGWLLAFRDGRLIRYDVFADHDEALRAAGLQP